MNRVERRISYEEFVASLPKVLDELGRDEEAVLVERHGKVYTITRADKTTSKLPKQDPELVRKALRESAGALKGVDVKKLKADLRIQRQQDSRGRPG